MGNIRSKPESVKAKEKLELRREHGPSKGPSFPSEQAFYFDSASSDQALDSDISRTQRPATRDYADSLQSIEVPGTFDESRQFEPPHPVEELEICSDDIESSPLEYRRAVLMRGGLGLTEPPEVTQWQSFTEIYLMENQLTELPENPHCPVLLVLFLNRNCKLRTISSSFFDYMPALEILNLSRTRIKSLPESLFKLSRLKRLFLNHCELLTVLPPKIGELQQLEVLDLEGTEIMDLPKEVAKLTKLTYLGVSFCQCTNRGRKSAKANALIPQGTVSALSLLEELIIDVNPGDERWASVVETIVDEVCGLMSLDTLKLYFPQVAHLRKFKWFGISEVSRSLSHFKFIVGNDDERIMSRLPVDLKFELEHWDRSLKYVNGVGVPIDIQKMLRHTSAFFLDRHTDVTKLSDFGIENMEQLKCCVIGECNEIQIIIDGTDVYDEADRSEIVLETWEDDKRFLRSLEYLCVYHMKSLKGIYEGPMHRGCFSHLKSLALLTCPGLTTIFTPGLLENLDSLEELKVEDCPLVLSLVRCEDTVIYESTYFLPKLKKLSLFSLPELISISNGLRIAPKLERMSISDCPNLKGPSFDGICCNYLTGTKAQSTPNDASIEQPVPPVVSSTTAGNAAVNPSTSKLKREPRVAPRLWKFLSARNFSDASLLGEGGSGCARDFTNDTGGGQPVPPGVSSTTTSNTAINSSVSSTSKTDSNAAITFQTSSEAASDFTINSLTSKLKEETIAAPLLRKFSLNDLKLATRNFSPKNLLGEGSSSVFKGWIEENGTAPARPGTGLTVAVRTFRDDGLMADKEWLAEVSILGHLVHPNLVRLIGFCEEVNQRMLIYEFMQRGSLDNHLFKRGTLPLPWSTRMKIALDAAKGLAFLHEEAEPKVILRNFKTSKILLDADYNVKLSGFGVAKTVSKGDSSLSSGIIGTLGYIDPEYMVTGHVSVKSDVYGFGAVLLEILTGQKVLDQSPTGEGNLRTWALQHVGEKSILYKLIDLRLGSQFSEEGAQIAWQLVARCLSLNQKDRPRMSEVVGVLKDVQDLPYMASTSEVFRTRDESAGGVMELEVEPR